MENRPAAQPEPEPEEEQAAEETAPTVRRGVWDRRSPRKNRTHFNLVLVLQAMLDFFTALK